MSSFCGSLTGQGTPVNQRTGRTHAYRSSFWRRATLTERKRGVIHSDLHLGQAAGRSISSAAQSRQTNLKEPAGVVSGPLMPTRYSLNASSVSWGRTVSLSKFFSAVSPAYTSIQAIFLLPLYA